MAGLELYAAMTAGSGGGEAALAAIMRKWTGRAMFIERLRELRAGEADLAALLGVFAQAAEMREKAPNEIFELRGAAGPARAFAAALGCARLLRRPLPVNEVGKLLGAPDALVALAAERYLEAEDSPAARALVLARHPDEARILGARLAFLPDARRDYPWEPLGPVFAAVCDRRERTTAIGRYDAKTLAFAPVLKLPGIEFGRMDLWVDENERRA